jgi:hypothetical protein
MAKYTPTLAQSGLLAELLRRERGKMTEVARRRARRRRGVCRLSECSYLAVARTHGPRLASGLTKRFVRTVAHHT